MYERLDTSAMVAMQMAQREATERGDFEVEPLHILLGLVRVKDETAHLLLQKGVTEEQVIKRLPAYTPELRLVVEPVEKPVAHNRVAKNFLYIAAEEAQRNNDPFVRTEYILGALFNEPLRAMSDGPDIVALLTEFGVTPQTALDLAASRVKTEQQRLENKAAKMLIRDKEIAGQLLNWLQTSSHVVGIEILEECGLDRKQAQRRMSLYLRGLRDES